MGKAMQHDDLIARIQDLQEKEIKLTVLQNLVLSELGSFVSAWDSGDSDRLPANRQAMINEVRRVLEYVAPLKGDR